MQVIEYWEPGASKSVPPRKGYVGSTDVQASLWSATVPRFDQSMHFPIWLAFASVDYLRDEIGLIPDITLMAETFPNPAYPVLKVASSYTNLAHYSFPVEILFTNIGKYKGKGGEGEALFSLPPPYATGFFAGYYRVSSWSLAESGYIPNDSEFVAFCPNGETKAPQGEPNVAPYMRVQVRTRGFRTLNDPDPICSPPALAGQLILVTDYRTNVQGLPLRYPSTNGVLLAMDDPKYSKLTAQVGKMTADIKQRHAKALGLSRWKFIGVLLLVTLIFPLLLWRRRKSEQTTTKRRNC